MSICYWLLIQRSRYAQLWVFMRTMTVEGVTWDRHRWVQITVHVFPYLTDGDSSHAPPRAVWRRNMSWILSFRCDNSHGLFDLRVLWFSFVLSFLICRMRLSRVLLSQDWHKDTLTPWHINTCTPFSTLPATCMSYNDKHENIHMYLHCALNYKMSHKANGLSPLENLIHVSIV